MWKAEENGGLRAGCHTLTQKVPHMLIEIGEANVVGKLHGIHMCLRDGWTEEACAFTVQQYHGELLRRYMFADAFETGNKFLAFLGVSLLLFGRE